MIYFIVAEIIKLFTDIQWNIGDVVGDIYWRQNWLYAGHMLYVDDNTDNRQHDECHQH